MNRYYFREHNGQSHPLSYGHSDAPDSGSARDSFKPASPVCCAAMSTSDSVPAPNSVSLHPDEPADPLDVYPELVERNDEVCKRCYTIIRKRVEYPWVKGEAHGDRAAFVTSVDDGSWLGCYEEQRELVDRIQSAAPPGKELGTTTACRCGAIETHEEPDTRSAEDAIRAAAGISQTLTELEVAHDWFVLLARVRELKTRPSFAGNDFRTFRRATAQAVHVARHGSVAAFASCD